MKKFLIAASVICIGSVGFVACQKEQVQSSSTSNDKDDIKFQLINDESGAVDTWYEVAGECYSPATNCLAPVVVMPNWYDWIMDLLIKWGEVNNKAPWAAINNTEIEKAKDDLKPILGEENLSAVLEGTLLLKARKGNDDSGNHAFLGLFENNDSVEPVMVYPIERGSE